ncbi:MAG: 1,4-dihydroxy-2-naphthoate polyprenyltransferase [Chloroflexi bacterium]|nr:1,4-dihydroxy-2-naphthoate polyprenyltransferase [Chloroflexota bacterium]
MNKTSVWIEAMRPRTLPLALASIILGGFLAAAADSLDWITVVLAGLTAVFLQILSNLANDYGDSVHGADHVERLGPKRAVQSGQISATAMKRAMVSFALLSVGSGLVLIWLSLGQLAWLFLVFGLLGGAAIWAAINYTAGRNPYGYAGLGDIFVLIFFGWAGVMGAYFLQTGRFDWLVMLPATSCGLLAVAVLNVNNIRDIESDEKAGKISIPVRLGPERARIYHWILLGTAVFAAALYVILNKSGLGGWLFLLGLPMVWGNGTAVSRTYDPLILNPLLKKTSLMTLAFVILFGLGQLL